MTQPQPDAAPIDWTQPIETVPCSRNPEPVPCVVTGGPDHDGDYTVRILEKWIDSDGATEGGTGVNWLCSSDGEFFVLDGSVRNVSPAEPVTVEPDPITADEVRAFATVNPDEFRQIASEMGIPMTGKTLRDEFAIAALAATSYVSIPSAAATRAYRIADAMMTERERNT